MLKIGSLILYNDSESFISKIWFKLNDSPYCFLGVWYDQQGSLQYVSHHHLFFKNLLCIENKYLTRNWFEIQIATYTTCCFHLEMWLFKHIWPFRKFWCPWYPFPNLYNLRNRLELCQSIINLKSYGEPSLLGRSRWSIKKCWSLSD